MQRQSLGSPAAKLNINGVITISTRESSSSSCSSPLSVSSSTTKASPQKKLLLPCNDEEDGKSPKKFHHKSASPFGHPEKFIHLIPLLTLFCILVLYLFSHSPSQTGNLIESTHIFFFSNFFV
ncbi:OLC1v1031135C1 [Oldenlandia corymbosa var. corymbosa]|uniref:OLC1v1031135C1 n=1 Tax=Oldenlandia corymbosa var. corymbosa TaxID=529605 RepID=A0AAV1CL56_OLDCO|nr:OLC1v1031135C1 [Oldenlandia corymbosa var. corymbosa]